MPSAVGRLLHDKRGSAAREPLAARSTPGGSGGPWEGPPDPSCRVTGQISSPGDGPCGSSPGRAARPSPGGRATGTFLQEVPMTTTPTTPAGSGAERRLALGRFGETYAARHLVQQGLVLLD